METKRLFVKRYELTSKSGELYVIHNPQQALNYKNSLECTVRQKVEEVFYDTTFEQASQHLESVGCVICSQYEVHPKTGKRLVLVSDGWYKKAEQFRLSSPVSNKGNVQLGRQLSKAAVEQQYGWNKDFNGWDYTSQQAWCSGGTSLISNKRDKKNEGSGIVDHVTYGKYMEKDRSFTPPLNQKADKAHQYINRVQELKLSGLSNRAAKKIAKSEIYSI